MQLLDCQRKDDKGNVEIEKKPAVVVTDPKGFVTAICEKRKVRQHRNHIGLDGGGGFLKLCLNVIEEPLTPKSPAAKKFSFGSGRFADTGVKKLFIIGLIPSVQENYHNVKALLETAGVTNLQFSLATDMKLANILCGIMSHGSRHPCCWCEISKGQV